MSRCSSVGSSPDVDDPNTTDGSAARAGAGEHRLLEGEPLGGALLHEVGRRDRVVGGCHELQRAFGRAWHVGEPVGRPPGVVEHLADLARRVGIGVVEVDVDAVEHEAGCPAATDHAAAEQPDPVEPRYGGAHLSTMSPMRATRRQPRSGKQRPAWPGNAITFTPASRA